MELQENEYQIGGISINEIAQKYETPLYVYDAEQMQLQYSKLHDAFSKKCTVKLNYACKALTNINVLRLFNKMGSGLDTVSIQEVWLGKQAGFEAQDIIYTPNCVSMEEIDLAVNEGVKINIDNLSILEQFGIKYGNSYPVCVRVNPHILAGGNHNISVGHIDSKFGISIYQLPHVHRIVETNNMTIEGLHMHTGSDILDVEVFLNGAELLLDAAKDFKELDYVDFGSGFKVPYKPNDISTDVESLGEQLGDRFISFCEDYGKDLMLMFEPGKFLVSDAGYFLATVNVVKQTTSTVFAGLDTGFNHLIRPMFYDSHHEIVNVSNTSGKERIYTVVGYICETDCFGWNRRMHEISEGNVLCFKNAGAYCFSMASNYNSRFRPAEVLIHEGKDYLIRERETMEDLTRNQVEVL